MLVIKKIKIKNYRQFRGEHELFLDPRTNRNVVIIEGKNGTGKTNFLNAIYWCLYEEEPSLTPESREYGILNVGEQNIIKEDEEKVVKVEIYFSRHVAGSQEFIVTRQVIFKKINGKIKPLRRKLGVLEFNSEKKTWEVKYENEDAQEFINNLLPREICDFFFFDGEQLDKFFKIMREISEKVKKAILKTTLLAVIDRAKKHLESVFEGLIESLEEQKYTDKRIDNIREELKIIKEEITQLEEKIERIKQELISLEEKIVQIDNELEQLAGGRSPKEIQKLVDEYKMLQDDLQQKKKELLEINTKILELITTRGYLALAKRILQETLKKLETKLPQIQFPEVSKKLLLTILKTNICICKRKLDDASKKEIESLLNNIMKAEKTQAMQKLRRNIERLLNEANTVINEYHGLNSERNTIKKEIEDICQRLRILQSKISEEISQKVRNLLEKRDRIIQRINDLKNGLKEAQEENQRKKETKRNLEKRLEEMLGRKEELRELSLKYRLCEQSLGALDKLHKMILNEIREYIQEETEKYFRRMVLKKYFFERVDIDDNFRVRVFDKYNKDCISVLSAGERQLLAMAFMIALQTISGFESPIIIDTPLARLSKEPKEVIAGTLPKVLQNKQLILLVTDEEYRSIANTIDNYVTHKYKLEFNEKECKTIFIREMFRSNRGSG